MKYQGEHIWAPKDQDITKQSHYMRPSPGISLPSWGSSGQVAAPAILRRSNANSNPPMSNLVPPKYNDISPTFDSVLFTYYDVSPLFLEFHSNPMSFCAHLPAFRQHSTFIQLPSITWQVGLKIKLFNIWFIKNLKHGSYSNNQQHNLDEWRHSWNYEMHK